MAKLKGNGAPTRKTIGGMGDIYTDVTTGKQYECIFAYRDNADGKFDCQWKEIAETSTAPEVKEVQAENPSGEIQEKQPKKKPAKKASKPVHRVAEPEELEEKAATPKRTNYTAYSKKTIEEPKGDKE